MFAWLAALCVVAWLVLAGRAAALERSERATAAFAAVVEQQVARTFQAVNLTLGAVADAQQLGPRPRRHDPGFQRMMARRLQDVPFVRAIYVIDADGRIVHDTDYPGTPDVSLADRPYFRAYQSDAALGGAVWPPVLSRSGTGWFLPATRPLGRGTAFEGIVVAAVQADNFRQQFQRIGLSDDYLVTLFHAEGTMVASYPALQDQVGKSFAELETFKRSQRLAGATFWTSEGMVAGERVVSLRPVDGAPFVVRIERSKQDALAEWRRTALGAGVAMLALTFLLGWFLARLARESARRRRERDRRLQAEKLEALGQMTGGMAHDFANLLNVVALNVERLRAGSADRMFVDGLAGIERAVRSGMGIVERLLAFARRRPLALQRVRLDTWLQAARPLLAQAAGSRVALSVEAPPGLAEILCDPGELDTALVNLIVNARDAMAGSGRIEVSASASDEESRVRLTVRDSGPGMTEEVRRRALEPFYSTKGEAGTGLGLSQVYGFMQQLGGSMSIDSEPGHGTAVHLFFPVAPAEATGPG